MLNQKSTKAFSLLEISIVLVIFAIMLSLSILSVAKILGSKAENKAFEEIEEVKQAIERFRVQNGRYPCPAKINLTPDDVDYGQEAQNALGNECFSGAAGGYAAATNIAGDGFARVSPDNRWNSSVLIGAVPFVDLGIDGKFAVDKWGNKYVYAVTEILATDVNGTTPTDLADNAPAGAVIPTALRGGIQVQDAFSGAIITPYNADANLNRAADFIVLSAGPDGNGAFNKNSNAQQPCLASGIGAREAENCDFNNNVFVTSGTFSTIEDPNYFYDLVSWNSSVSNNINVTGSGDFKDRVYIRGREVPDGFATLRVDGRTEITVGADPNMAGINNNNLRVGRNAPNCTVPLVGGLCPDDRAYSLAVDGRTNIWGVNNTANLVVGNNPPIITDPATGFTLAVDGRTNLGGNTNITVGGGANNSGNLRVGNNPPAKGFSLAVDGDTNLGGAVNVAGRSEFNNFTVLPNQTESGVCINTNIGAVRYNTTKKILEVCDGAAWKNINMPKMVVREVLSAQADDGYMQETACCNSGEYLMSCAGARDSDLADKDSEENTGLIGVLADGNCCKIAVDTGKGRSRMRVQALCWSDDPTATSSTVTNTPAAPPPSITTCKIGGTDYPNNTLKYWDSAWQRCLSGAWNRLTDTQAKALPCVKVDIDNPCSLGYVRKKVTKGQGNVVDTNQCCPQNSADLIFP